MTAQNPAEVRPGRSPGALAAVGGRRCPAQQVAQPSRLGGDDDFRRTQALQFGQQRRRAFQLGCQKITRGQVHQREAENFPRGMDGGDEIIPFRHEHAFIEVRAGGEDLRHLALHQFAGPGLFGLIAEGHLAPGLEQAGDVAARGVVRQAAHRDPVARGEREVEEMRAGLSVLEEHLVEIPQPEQQERVRGEFALDAAILCHHGRELGFGRHDSGKSTGEWSAGRNETTRKKDLLRSGDARLRRAGSGFDSSVSEPHEFRAVPLPKGRILKAIPQFLFQFAVGDLLVSHAPAPGGSGRFR